MTNYEVSLCYEGNELVLTQTLPDGERDTRIIDLKEVSDIENRCKNTSWHTSFDSSRTIGESIFNLLNGDRQLLVRALKEADNLGETLSLFAQSDIDIPFELLYSSNFLVPSRIHCIRKVSDYGCRREIERKNRPLKVLFMACSPEGISVLDFEKEEETILKITENLPIDMDVEDTGSLEGLYDQLKTNEYDVIHITGHADIDEEPFFCMEDDTGELVKVRPSELYEVLNLNPPRLLFLSGCRTGETPRTHVSFAQSLVLEHFPSVLSWGLPVTDEGATRAAANLYFELSRGNLITEAVFSARKELFEKKWPDWCLLRLFSDGTPLIEPLVKKGQKWKPRERDLRYRFLEHSQVKVLDKGFVGRRRQIQRGFKCLKKDSKKVGVLLHGTGGLGKSCLAGKLCERFKDHTLIVVHGRLDSVTFMEALKDAFIRKNDKNGLAILEEDVELPLKIIRLCSTSFKENPYLIVMDDFEKNLEVKETPLVSPEAVPILETLLKYLYYAGKMSQLIITSRYTFPLTVNGKDIVEDQLELIGLTSFRGADERKKVSELRMIADYPDLNVRQKLISAGHGNPRLLEILNTLLEEQQNLNISSLLKEVKGKKEEFVEELFLRRLLEGQSANFVKVIQRLAVYRLPVTKEAIELVCKGMVWEPLVDKGVQVSLIEEDRKGSTCYYWVTPLLREELSAKCGMDEKQLCHKAAVEYYEGILNNTYTPVYSFELIEHALACGMDDNAVKEGGRLLGYLRNALAYKEALQEGNYILSKIKEFKRDENSSRLLYEFGWILHDTGDSKKAIEYYEKALEIDREIYGEKHPYVATTLNNLGLAWNTLGDSKKAIEYYKRALEIDREIYGEKHPSIASTLNNLGSAWDALGDSKKAIEYFERALEIDREIYGEKHPSVASTLNNLGSAWNALGDSKKAIEYYERALEIDREIYGEKHPDVAIRLNNLGSAWYALGDSKKAIEYYERALEIDREIYGEKHPDVATDLNNLGLAWDTLGDSKKAIEYFERALEIDREIYGEKHPSVARDLNNLGGAWDTLGDSKKAIDYYEKALEIDREIYGEKHPSVARDLNNLGLAWDTLGDSKKAIEYFERALEIDREIYGEKHPSVATRLNNLGGAWNALGDSKKAIEYYEKALEIDREIYGEKHPSVATRLNNLGGAWNALGDSKKALDYIQQAYHIFREFYGDQHPRTKIAKEWLDNLKS